MLGKVVSFPIHHYKFDRRDERLCMRLSKARILTVLQISWVMMAVGAY